MHAQAAYDELIRRTRESSLLDSCASLLAWDEETYMPRGAAAHRGEQMALLAGLHHERVTHPRIGELLGELEGSALVGDPLSAVAVNVRELRRSYHRVARLPRRLVEELARVTSLAQQVWIVAREKSDFARFRRWLEKIIKLKRQEAEALGYADCPYDALLDEYEPDARSRDVAGLFETLRRELVPLVAAITYAGRRSDRSVLERDFALDRQRAFGEQVAAALGFDFQSGRLDTTTHPFFATIGPGDCRLTTRFKRRCFNDGFFGILHEVGHGLYEQGLDPAAYGTPMGEAASLGLHESQSRLWENTVGRSLAFWQHFFPEAQRTFSAALGDVKLEEFHFAVNHVAPSLNRVQADEVTYDLHILVRFELEQALLHGDLDAAGVPDAWNEKYRHYLGIAADNDAEGCLQDGHWGAGLIGYFPTYTLGNVFAAQLFASASAELGDLQAAFARGNFTRLLDWLREKVHRHGCRYRSAELIKQATGSYPDPRALIASLKQKYKALYRI